MGKPVIGLDLDGVVYDFQGTYKYLLSKHRDVRFPDGLEWWDTWDSADQYTTAEDRRWVWSTGIELGLFRYGHIVKGAIDGVRELAKVGHIQVVTHRPQSAVRDTLAFLAYVDLPIQGVTVTQGPKSAVACDVYVDDGPHVLTELMGAGKRAVVFDRPYNRGFLDQFCPEPKDAYMWSIARALNWAEVPAVVKELS